ncbi:MAG: hypothetical protein OXI46_08030 [Gemmatimonadota bacterium]|nr:hypothetical protein [Gemmatimonadota bacterium]
MIESPRLFACTLIALVAACGDSGIPRQFVVTDSSGIKIASSSLPAWSGGNFVWSLDTIPAVEIAGNPDVADQTLFDVWDLELLSDGRVVILNGGSSQLLVFDSTGAFLDTWGRARQGPDEFDGPSRLDRCAGDTLIVTDRVRMSVLDSDGAFARSVRLSGVTASRAFDIEGVARACSSALVALRHVRPPSGPGERTFRYPTEVYWARFDDGSRTSVGSFRGNEVMTVALGGDLLGARFPFGVHPVWTSDGERVFYGPADRHEVHIFGGAGQLERIVRWSASLEPISEHEWTRYDEWREAEIEEDPAGSLMPTRADHPSELRPTYSDLLVDDEGNLWLQRYDDPFLAHYTESEPQRWSVFDQEGRWLGELTMPPRFSLSSVARGLAIGVARDQLDVETIRFLRLRKHSEG